MKRILVIGSGGAGKSTFSRRLGEITGIEVIHLDKLYWKPNWTETPKDEWQATVFEILEKDEWILDGNFGGTMKMRIAASDTVIYLDFPRTVCLYQALRRTFTYWKKTRPDMGAGCGEHFNPKFLRWIWRFPKDTKPTIESRLKSFETEKTIIRLKSRSEVEHFFADYSQIDVLK